MSYPAAVGTAFSIVLMLAVFIASHRTATYLKAWTKSRGKLGAVVCTVAVAVLLLFVFGLTSMAGAILTSRAPIFIKNDNSFTSANGVTGGSGTQNDPYIIENLVIDASGADGIKIQNTTKCFIIRNCLVENGGNSHSGIFLDNVVNGRIESNTCSNNDHGIHLVGSSNNTLTNNTCSNNDHGIHLMSSSSNILSNNTCLNNAHGIHLMFSSGNILDNNACENNSQYGIYLKSSSNNTITRNRLLNNAENNARDDSTNYWDKSEKGNYWGDWQPPEHFDVNADGIVDEPREISGGNNWDNYPLVLKLNLPPVADAGGPYVVNENENITLNGRGSSDPDNDNLSYSWVIKSDPTGRASLTESDTVAPTFHAPDNLYAPVDVTVELTVDDGYGHTSSDSAVITVHPANPRVDLPFSIYVGLVISTVVIMTVIVVGYSVYLMRRARL
jgi:parallel beta-helix repeat protein